MNISPSSVHCNSSLLNLSKSQMCVQLMNVYFLLFAEGLAAFLGCNALRCHRVRSFPAWNISSKLELKSNPEARAPKQPFAESPSAAGRQWCGSMAFCAAGTGAGAAFESPTCCDVPHCLCTSLSFHQLLWAMPLWKCYYEDPSQGTVAA